jgi:uncharacterized protein (TIRG00374 family)
MRWRLLLGPPAAPRSLRVLAAAVIAGQVSNVLLPFRLGDAVRIAAVPRLVGLPVAAVMASVAVERVFDVMMVALTAAALAGVDALPPFARAGMFGVSAGLGAVFGAGILWWRTRHAWDALAARASRVIPDRPLRWIATHASRVAEGLARVAQPVVLVRAFCWSVAVIAASVFTAWLLLVATGIAVPPVAAAVVVIAVQIGTVAIPVPGGIGVSQVLTVQTLALWGVPEAPALSYALMLYVVARAPKVVLLPAAMSVLARAAAGVR